MKGLALFLVFCLFPLAPVRADGFGLAQKYCARCHAIDPAKPWDSIGSTPSFMLMAKKLASYEQRVLSVGERRPHIAQELNPDPEELLAILGYIRTLVD